MTARRTRRAFLGAVAAPALVGVGRAGRAGWAASTARAGDDAFRPSVHGFGFRNWSTAVPTFPEHVHESVAEEDVRRGVGREWRGALEGALALDASGLSSAVIDAIAKQVYVSLNQRSATNGHCYGMTFVAQRYFERPEEVPFGRATASELTHPAEPVEDPSVAPVGREVDYFQNRQFLDPYAWLGRRVMAYPAWIDYGAQLSVLRSVVEAYGTAGVTLLDTATGASHQILVHDVRDGPSGFSLAFYDPNRPAAEYENAPPARIDLDRTDDGYVVRPYGRGFDAFVYNRYDRAIAARGDTDPLEHVDGSAVHVRRRLTSLALFLVDSPAVHLAVLGPDGRPVRRDRSPFMDRRHTEYHSMRYRYGPPPGRYRVVLTGEAATEYALLVKVASPDGEVVATEVTDSIGAGEVHAYTATVPESGTSGTLERDRDGAVPHWLLGGAGIAVGAAGAVYAFRRRGRPGE